MVAIEHRSKSSTTTLLSPSSTSTSSQSTTGISTPTTKTIIDAAISTTTTTTTTTTTIATESDVTTTTTNSNNNSITKNLRKATKTMSTSDVSSPTVTKVINKKSQQLQQQDVNTIQEISKRTLKLDLNATNEFDESLKSPKSPIVGRLPSHQNSLVSAVDVEDRKTLREALYQGIFHRHRRTIFAVGSFLRMLRSRNSQYNTIRSTSENDEEIR